MHLFLHNLSEPDKDGPVTFSMDAGSEMTLLQTVIGGCLVLKVKDC